MTITENILSQIYMSQNYDAQPLKSETSKANEQKNVSGQKPEVDKSLENRTVFQINNQKYNLTSAEFRVALYEYAKGRTSLEKELPTIRQRLGLTDKGESQVQENKALDTRSVINEIFARSGNVQAKINDALAGVVKFPKDVQKAICDAIWRQRDNPGIRKFLQSGGSSQDLAGICKLTLDSMKAHGCKSFADRMTMSYLKGFTLSMTSSPITFSTEFEKSFEGDLLIREERTGTENRRTVELKSLEVATEEALAKLENETKNLLPASDKKDLSVGEKYLQKKYGDARNELQRYCATRKGSLDNAADAESLEKLLGEEFNKELSKKVDDRVEKMKEFHQRAKRLDLLAKLELKSDTVFGAEPEDPKEKSSYDQACKKFKADYDKAMTFAEGEMWEYLSELKEEELTDEGLKKIWNDHYQNASRKIGNEETKEKNKDIKEQQGEVKKNAEEKANPVKVQPPPKNQLDDYVSNNAFKEKILPTYDKDPNGPLYKNDEFVKMKEEAKKILRETIIPKWNTLTHRLEELRQETMRTLKIDSGKEAWFKIAHPKLDVSSESFLDCVYKEMTKGGSVQEIENRILAACRLKNEVSFKRNDDDKSILLYFTVGKNPSGTEEDNTIYVESTEVISNEGKYLEQIEKFALERKLSHDYVCNPEYNPSIKTAMANSVHIDQINEAFKQTRGLDQVLAQVLDEEKTSLQSMFTEVEIKTIAGVIQKAVIEPIEKADNVWNISPTTLMDNFVKLCVDKQAKNAEDVKSVVQTIIKAQVDEHFKLKQSNEKRECLIDSGWTGKYAQEASPGEVIKRAIENKRGLRQHGGANCFMVSIVNALLGNVKGQQILKDCFCREDKQYHFKNRKGKEFTFTDADVDKWMETNKKDYAAQIGNMSKLERVIWTAWHKALEDENTLDKYMSEMKYCPGAQCPAPEVAFLFGLADANNESGKNVTKYGVSLAENKLERWVDAKNHLESGQFVIAHQGTMDGGHYVAVTGVGSEAQGEGKHFTISDSYFDDKSRFDLDSIQLGDGKLEGGNSSIILLTLPNNVT